MSAVKKQVPRAVLEERLRVLEEAKEGRRLFTVKFGVWIALIVGVLASQAIVMADDLSATLNTLELSQVGGSILVGSLAYNKLENSPKDIVGKAKKGNVSRVLRTAFYHGFTWMTLLGAWW